MKVSSWSMNPLASFSKASRSSTLASGWSASAAAIAVLHRRRVGTRGEGDEGTR